MWKISVTIIHPSIDSKQKWAVMSHWVTYGEHKRKWNWKSRRFSFSLSFSAFFMQLIVEFLMVNASLRLPLLTRNNKKEAEYWKNLSTKILFYFKNGTDGLSQKVMVQLLFYTALVKECVVYLSEYFFSVPSNKN